MPAEPWFPTGTGAAPCHDALALHVRLLHAEADSWTDAMLLGQAEFQTARVYLQGDLALRKQAFANAGSIDGNRGRCGRPDPLI